ncbi:unnamed protein product [Ixodes pacificus]
MTCCAASTGYGYLVCTVGAGAYFKQQYPISRGLCDLIVYSHVVAKNDSFDSTTGSRSYKIFLEIAKQYKSSKHMSFGISMSPGDLSPQLDDPKLNLTDFANAAKLAYKESGIGSYGTLGLPRTVQDFKFQEPLKNWYKVRYNNPTGCFQALMVYLAYRMKTAVKADSKKQGACVHNAPMTFDTYCIEPAPNEQVDSDSLTASNYQGTTLRTYETMEKVVFPVDDKAYRRPGWALFDIQVEIYDDVLCQRNISKPAVFARIIAAKDILEKNRKRTFPPGR